MSRDEVVPDAVSENWEGVLEEARAQAEQYRTDDWDALVVHPGDVTAVSGEPFGVDVLAPGEEYELVQTVAEEHDFDQSQIYRQAGEIIFVLAIFEATADDVAVLVPLFLSQADLQRLRGRARERGAMPVHVRPLSDESRVTFTVDDPDLFFGDQ